MDWQPIETAPKDGTPVLVWDYGAGACVVAIIYEGRWVTDWNWDQELGKPDPTHWMPLPEPPK